MYIMETVATFKLCVFGDGGVGKTTLTRRFLTGLFEMDTKITMGASIFVKFLDWKGKRISLQIWDFGGEEQFRFLLPSYAIGSAGGIFMFDLSRYATLGAIDQWLEFFRGATRNQDIPIIMVGGKSDLVEHRSVERKDAIQLTKKHNFYDYIECSSKSGDNVDRIINYLTEEMMKNVGLV